MNLIAIEPFSKSNWIKFHPNHCFKLKDQSPNTILLGDSYLNIFFAILCKTWCLNFRC